tara:strand:+ start:19899 stop:21710 length:1812 start_codon:yes stop_codon:yes gene_type:complete
MNFVFLPRFVRFALLGCGVVMSLGACDSFENTLKTDRSGGLTKQDYRDALAPRDIPEDDAHSESRGSAIPELQPYVAHSYTARRTFPLVSVSVNRSVPLRDVFYQLAQQAEYDLELDPSIRGSMIFTARNRPLNQVVERICDLAGLRYTLDDGVLRVERDTPYNKIYKLDYLSFIRENSSTIDTSVSVVSGEGADTGSSFSSSFESSTDFWTDLEDNLTNLLMNESKVALITADDPSVSVLEPSGSGAADAVVSIGAIGAGESGNAGGGDEEDGEASFVINRQAGLISIYATQSTHKEVSAFLTDLKRAITAQVLIEAKVMEVALNDEFSAGIDWNLVQTGIGDLDLLSYVTDTGFTQILDDGTFDANPTGAEQGGQTPASALYALYDGDDFEALIRAIAEYGTTKALASPRLVVLNNQSAVLNVARNRVFFIVTDTQTEEDADTGDETRTFTYETRTVPEGVIINVMPSINLDERSVSLAVRPSVTDIGNDLIQNPFVDAETFIPQVSIQEVDTVLNVDSGEAVIIGGLMKDSTTATEDGVPVLADMPLVGNLFRGHFDRIEKTELVIFLRATILDKPSDSIHDADRDLYRKFSDDRRPFKM